MLVLSIESSTQLGSVALVENNVCLEEKSSARQRSHSEFLNSAIADILKNSNRSLSEVDLIAVTNGPGSFTGIRVAGNIAKTLAYALQKPLWVTDSLSVLNQQARLSQNVFCCMNAFKNMLYVSAFIEKKIIIPPTVINIDEVGKIIKDTFNNNSFQLIGDAQKSIKELLSDTNNSQILSKIKTDNEEKNFPQASTLGQMAKVNKTMDWNSFLPLYLRNSEAEENLRLRAAEKK